MTQQTKEEIYKKYYENYKKSIKKEKSEIIDNIAELTNHNRKHVIRRLNNTPREVKKGEKRTGRRKKYSDTTLIEFIISLWKVTQNICSRRLKEAIRIWLPYYDKELSEEVKELLKTISSSTIDRIIREQRNKYNKKWKCTTKPGSLLKKEIPIHTNKWDTTKPGYLEADTVSHGGNSCSGSYAYSVVTTDIATGWVEIRATWEKGQNNVHKAIMDIEESLPFPLLGFDSDNGCEFINHHLKSYFEKRKHKVQFTRSKPYIKNDNAHVEQKNWTHVRQYIGYARFDKMITVEKLNDIYKNYLNILMNYFIPSEQLLSKFFNPNSTKTYKIMSSAKTPFERLKEKYTLTEEQLDYHNSVLKNKNPYILMKELIKKIKDLYVDYSTDSGLGEVNYMEERD